LECLPDWKCTPGSLPWIFHSETGGPSFLVNARSYCILGVGAGKQKDNRQRQRLAAAPTDILAHLMARNTGISFNGAQHEVTGVQLKKVKTCKLARMSTTKKNYRKPPLRKSQNNGKTISEDNDDAQDKVIGEEEINQKAEEMEEEEHRRGGRGRGK